MAADGRRPQTANSDAAAWERRDSRRTSSSPFPATSRLDNQRKTKKKYKTKQNKNKKDQKNHSGHGFLPLTTS